MIDWHYPRPELARTHLAQLFDQGLSRLAFFGRRRIGKTEYLKRDLIPAAAQKGVVNTFYCSFWENKDQPHLALIRALQDALPQHQTKVKAKAGLNIGVLDFSAEVERPDRPRPALPNELSLATISFHQWVRHLEGQPGLIVLDEIQHLATSSAFANFAASLRTLLDMAPPTLQSSSPGPHSLICNACSTTRKHRSSISPLWSIFRCWIAPLSIIWLAFTNRSLAW